MGHGSALSPSMWPLVLFLWVLVLVLSNSPGLLVWRAVPVWFPVCAAGCRPPSRFWTTVFLQDRHRVYNTSSIKQWSNRERNHRSLCRSSEPTGSRIQASLCWSSGDFWGEKIKYHSFDCTAEQRMTCVRRYWADVTLKLKCVLSADGWSGMEAITHQTHRGRHMSNTKFMIHKQLLI